MNIERVGERLANGFKPFIIEVSSGKRLAVRHPDFISIGKNVAVVVGPADSVTTADPLHIVALRQSPASKRRK